MATEVARVNQVSRQIKGYYLEITKVTVPETAEEGATVLAVIEITNVSGVNMEHVSAMAWDDIPFFQGVSQTLFSGSSGYWMLTFIMPAHSVSFVIYARYWGADGKWHTDDTYPVTVTLEAALELTGTIENPRIKYNLSYVSIPVANMPLGENFRLTFTGRNTSGINLKLGGTCQVWDPDNNSVFYDTDWEIYHTGPGGTHNFAFPSFPGTIPVNKVGTWRAKMRLYCLSEGVSVLLDETTEVIFTVPSPEEPAELSGIIESPGLIYNLTYGDIPLTEPVPYGKSFRITFTGRNTSTVNVKLHGSMEVWNPEGVRVFFEEDWEGVVGWFAPGQYTGPSGTHKFNFPKNPVSKISINKVGVWIARMILHGWDGVEGREAVHLDTETYEIFTVLPVEEEYVGEIRNKLVDLKPVWPGGEHAIPYTAEPVSIGQKLNISFDGCNLSDFGMRLRGELWVKSPTGRVSYNRDDVSAALYTTGACHEFIFSDIPAIDESGEWTVRIELTNSTGEYLLAEWEGVLFMVGVEIVFACPYCPATFPTAEELQAHILAEHPEEVEAEVPFWDKIPTWAWIGGAVAGAAGLALITREKKRTVKKP